MLVTLARANATNLSGLHHASIQEHERGGPGWTLEWIFLPPMVLATAAALRIMGETLSGLHVDTARMRANLDLDTGLIMAEAVTTALAAHIGKVEAQALVKQVCKDAPGSGRSITDLLRERCDAPAGLGRGGRSAELPRRLPRDREPGAGAVVLIEISR